MLAPGPWQPTTPWRRVWPAAVLVLALHAAFLHEWRGSGGGVQREAPLASAMVVRLLTSTPPVLAPAVVPPAEPPAARSAESTTGTEAPRPVPARESQGVAAGPDASASRPTAAASRATSPESDYLAGSRLDPGPKLLDDVDPVYPADAGLTEGSVVLRLLIGRTGTVDEVTVVQAQPRGLFDRSAVAAFAAARFSPGMLLGVPVKSQITIEVRFSPVDRGANVAAPTY